MMKVWLYFFAELRDFFGTAECEMNLKIGTTPQDAFFEWQKNSGKTLPLDLSVRFAINEQFAEEDQSLAPGDRVAVLTPFSGG